MKTVKLIWFVLSAFLVLTGCGSSGQAQMTPEKFKDMYGMLLKLDELKKKEEEHKKKEEEIQKKKEEEQKKKDEKEQKNPPYI